MKRHFLTVALLSVCLCMKAQSTTETVKGTPVQVQWISDWSQRMFIYPGNFWEDREKQKMITAQIGAAEYEKVRQFSRHHAIPCAFNLFCEDRDGKPLKHMDSLAKKFSKLKLYRIATFTWVNSKGNTIGPESLLRVPYEENKLWDTAVRWDTIYFTIADEYLTEATPGFQPKSWAPDLRFPSVEVSDWSLSKSDFDGNYWTDKRRALEISRKVGGKNSTAIGIFFKQKVIPAAFLPASYSDVETYKKKMSHLKAYKVTSYLHYNNAGMPEPYVVVRVPYSENKDWDPSVNWDNSGRDNILFVFPEKVVSVTNSSSIPPKAYF